MHVFSQQAPPQLFQGYELRLHLYKSCWHTSVGIGGGWCSQWWSMQPGAVMEFEPDSTRNMLERCSNDARMMFKR